MPPSTATQTFNYSATITQKTQTPTPTPSVTPTLCTGTAALRDWLADTVLITHYATVTENDPFFSSEDKNLQKYVPFYSPPFSSKADIYYDKVPKYAFYVGNACEGNCGNWRVSLQGSGELTESQSLQMSGGLKYVQADVDKNHLPDPVNNWQPSAVYYFTNEIHGACGISLTENASIAVASDKLNLEDGHRCGDKYYLDIPGFENTVFTVSDSGTFTVPDGGPDHFDIYVGAQTYDNYYHNPSFTQYDGKRFKAARVQP